jgi:hypothetical protein
MFQTIFFIGIAFVLLLAVARFVQGRPYPTDRAVERARMYALDRLIYAFMLACVFVLAATGLWSALTGEAMHHWGLMIHCTFAPPFAIGLAALAVSLADRCRVRCADAGSRRFGAMQNLLFWLLLPAGLVVILSAAIPMTGWEQLWQGRFLVMHRYSSLVFFILLMAHAVQFFNSGPRNAPPVVARQQPAA